MAKKRLNPAPTRYIYNPASSSSEGINTELLRSVVRHHAPDAIVLINRQIALPIGCSTCNCKRSIKEDITDINISAGVDTAPGAASFTVVAPRSGPTNYYDRGYFRITPMQEVNIYLKGRFPVASEGGELGAVGDISDINSPFPYYHSFWGVITSVKKSESATGNEVLSVECSDILRFWEMTNLLLNSSLANQDLGYEPTIFTTRFAEKKADEIILELARNIQPKMFIGNGLGAYVNGSEPANLNRLNKSLAAYWEERFRRIGASLQIFGYSGLISTSEDGRLDTPNDLKSQERTFVKITGENQRNIQLIDNVKPYFETNLQAPAIFQSDVDSMLNVAKTIAEVNKWEFYQDVTGNIVFKPPFYNFEVKNYPPHVIEPVEIIDETHTTEEGQVLTAMEVTGSLGFVVNNPQDIIYGRFTDFNLVLKYGYRTEQRRVAYLTSNSDVHLFARDALAVHNANVLQTATMTIVGRPEIRPGYPIYLPHKDMYYYVKSVSHSFSFGDSFTTSLTLSAGRKRVYSLPLGTNDEYGRGLNLDKEPLYNYYLVKREGDKITTSKGESQPTGSQLENKGQYKNSLFTDRGIWEFKRKEELQEDYSPTKSKSTVNIIPVTDEFGYELVGTLPYGRYLELNVFGEVDFNDDKVKAAIDKDPDVAERRRALSRTTGRNPIAGTARELLNTVTVDEAQGAANKDRSRPKSHKDKREVASSDRTPEADSKEILSIVPDVESGICPCGCHYEDFELDNSPTLQKNSDRLNITV